MIVGIAFFVDNTQVEPLWIIVTSKSMDMLVP